MVKGTSLAAERGSLFLTNKQETPKACRNFIALAMEGALYGHLDRSGHDRQDYQGTMTA